MTDPLVRPHRLAQSPHGIFPRVSWAIIGLALVMALATDTKAFGETADTANPAVLVASPRGTGSPHVDLTYLRELHDAGLEVDYLDHHREMTWSRIKQYNVLIIFGCPPAGETQTHTFPGTPPLGEAYVELIERFLEAGGGVFCMIPATHGDEHHRAMIEPWGARVPAEQFREHDPTRTAPIPRMTAQRDSVHAIHTDRISDSPISVGVDNLWLPGGERRYNSWSSAIVVDDNWQVVVKGSPTSESAPSSAGLRNEPLSEDVIVRESGVEAPDLLAIREYKNGRIAFCAIAPQFTLGQGTKWLYDRVVLSKGARGTASDFGRLIENAVGWLAEPSAGSGGLGGYTTDAERFQPPNFRERVRRRFEEHFWSDEELDLHRPPRDGEVYRGLIGAQTNLTGGSGTVEDYAVAAKDTGLDFLIFLEDFADLTPEKLSRLDELCTQHSDDQLLLVPGYRMAANVGNEAFFFGYELPWPWDRCLTGEDDAVLNLQHQDEQGEYTGKSETLTWILKAFDKSDTGHHVGFYDFRDPSAMKVYDVRAATGAGIYYYDAGELVEDATEQYLTAAWGTIPPSPFAINLVRSPAALGREVEAQRGLVYGTARSHEKLFVDVLSRSNQYSGPNVFPSNGPIIRAWPETYRVVLYGSERYVAGQDLMPSPVHVTADAGLKRVTIYNGDRVFRRFELDGAETFEQTLHLPGNVQRNMVLVAEDVNGGKAVSFARRCWKAQHLSVVFCGDHVNHCIVHGGLLGKGPGLFQVHRYPVLPNAIAGFTWDGGPRGLLPAVYFDQHQLMLESDKGKLAPGRFNNVSILEFSDDQVVVVRSELDKVYAPDVPPKNAWRTYGPVRDSKLMRSVRRFVEFNRPVSDVQPEGWPAWAVRAGASVASFEHHVRFKQDQTIKRLRLTSARPTTHQPTMIAFGDGEGGVRVINTHRMDGRLSKRLKRGDWFGVYAPQASNNTMFINRGEPVELQALPTDVGTKLRIEAVTSNEQVRAGDERHYALFSINDPLDVAWEGPERFLQLLGYLNEPEGMRVLRGERVDSLGFVDVRAEDGVVEVEVPQPARRLQMTLPLRIRGLNPNWSAGVYQLEGYSRGYYHDGDEVYGAVGIDFEGMAYAALYPDRAARTHVRIGHPIVCDDPDLTIQVTPRPVENADGGPRYKWHVDVNNTTDQPITATLRQNLDVPGLKFAETTLTLEPGGYRVLQD